MTSKNPLMLRSRPLVGTLSLNLSGPHRCLTKPSFVGRIQWGPLKSSVAGEKFRASPPLHSLKRICYQISQESRLEGLEIFWGPKDVSYLVDDPPGKAASKIRHDHPDLERSDNKFFSRNDSTREIYLYISLDSTISKAR